MVSATVVLLSSALTVLSQCIAYDNHVLCRILKELPCILLPVRDAIKCKEHQSRSGPIQLRTDFALDHLAIYELKKVEKEVEKGMALNSLEMPAYWRNQPNQ